MKKIFYKVISFAIAIIVFIQPMLVYANVYDTSVITIEGEVEINNLPHDIAIILWTRQKDSFSQGIWGGIEANESTEIDERPITAGQNLLDIASEYYEMHEDGLSNEMLPTMPAWPDLPHTTPYYEVTPQRSNNQGNNNQGNGGGNNNQGNGNDQGNSGGNNNQGNGNDQGNSGGNGNQGNDNDQGDSSNNGDDQYYNGNQNNPSDNEEDEELLTPSDWLQGNGSQTSPYLIFNADDLLKLTKHENISRLSSYFSLQNNIVAHPNTSIEEVFNGNFNGNFNTITLQNSNRNDNALFRNIGQNAMVYNLNLNGIAQGNDRIAALAINNYGTVKNVTSTANVTSINIGAGLVVSNHGSIVYSGVMGNVTSAGGSNFGGIAVSNQGNIHNSYFYGNVRGVNTVGGIAANNSGTISTSHANGSVATNGGSNVGGIAGQNSGIISNSYTTTNVNGVNNIGGISGNNIGRIYHTYTTGNINSAGGGNTGGIVGSNSGELLFNISFNHAINANNAGRIIGSGTAQINFAHPYVVVNGNTINNTQNLNHGTQLDLEELSQRDFWESIGFSSDIWTIQGALPTLLHTDGPQFPAPPQPPVTFIEEEYNNEVEEGKDLGKEEDTEEDTEDIEEDNEDKKDESEEDNEIESENKEEIAEESENGNSNESGHESNDNDNKQ